MVEAGRGLSGTFVTPRLFRIAVAFGLFALVCVPSLDLARSLAREGGEWAGGDFPLLWAAGVAAREGQPALVFDFASNVAHIRRLFGPQGPALGWHYPPYFLAFAWLLAGLPYAVALFAWLGATSAALLATGRAILRDAPASTLTIVLACAAFPGLLVNLRNGQNGALTAVLLGAALLTLRRSPVISGLLIAALAYKPHFGLLLPAALAAAGCWRAFTAAALGVLAMTAASVLAFGTESWLAFLDNLPAARWALEVAQANNPAVQSVYAALRWNGAPAALAWSGQGLVAILAILGVAWIWRRNVDFRLQSAALCAATLLASPYVMDYDLAILGVGAAFLAAHGLEKGFGRWEHAALALAWLAPAFARATFGATGLPVGALAAMALFAIAICRAGADAARAPISRQELHSAASTIRSA